MFNSRYSEMEMNHWQESAAWNHQASATDASRTSGTRASMAKGQSEHDQTRSTATAKMQTQNATSDDWASECLFDCYNG